METKHTPGEWVNPKLAPEDVARESDYTSICTMSSGVWNDEERMANARLIAAAPDLLAALELCLEELDSCDHEFEGTHYCGRCDSAIDRSHEIREKATKAIAKAKGEA